jgi:hypothetical protein
VPGKDPASPFRGNGVRESSLYAPDGENDGGGPAMKQHRDCRLQRKCSAAAQVFRQLREVSGEFSHAPEKLPARPGLGAGRAVVD